MGTVGHGVGELHHQAPGQGDPLLLYGLNQLGQRCHLVVFLQFGLENRPQIFNWVKIRQVARPIHVRDLVFLQEGHNLPAGTAGRPILEEVFGPVVGHPEKQFVLQHGNVTIAIHRYFGRQKVERASATQPTEATPHHYAGRMLHVPDGVALLVPASQARPPHLLSPGINEVESALIAKHNSFPVRFTPGAVFFAEAEAFFDHLGRQQRLFRHAARGQA